MRKRYIYESLGQHTSHCATTSGRMAVQNNPQSCAVNAVRKKRKKRGGGETVLALHELDECVSGTPRSDDSADIVQAIDSFLTVLPAMDRFIFVRRYWFMDSTAEISEQCGIKTSAVTTKLHRMRIKLKKHLEKEGIEI